MRGMAGIEDWSSMLTVGNLDAIERQTVLGREMKERRREGETHDVESEEQGEGEGGSLRIWMSRWSA
jgi:hypothetical protein